MDKRKKKAVLKSAKRRVRLRVRVVPKDTGTRELMEKNKAGLTLDPLDRLYRNDMIPYASFLAGVKLRKLYYRVNGAPHARGYDMSYIRGYNPGTLSEEEQIHCRRLYQQAFQWLEYSKTRKEVMDICVFGVNPPHDKETGDIKPSAMVDRLKDGLDFLSSKWKLKNTKLENC
ncbi:MAG: hypothetical protein IPP74_09595 [Alphaproteobacteria bacterium]|nr:hypothetical protein [Alphaproteobacteria bacterium]